MVKKPLLFTVLCVAVVSAAPGAEIIVESYKDGQNSSWFKVVQGKWAESSSKSTAPGVAATKAVYNDANTTDPAKAQFVPDIPETGEYEVFATYPKSGNAVGVSYVIKYAGGTTTMNVDQNGSTLAAKPAANTWFPLGTFKFNKGQDGYIEIQDPLTGKRAFEGEPNARIYADAVKFVPKGESSGAAIGSIPALTPGRSPSASAGAALPALPVSPAPGAGPGSLPLPGSLPPLPGTAASASSDMPSLPSLGAPPSSGSGPGPLPTLGLASSGPSALPSLSNAGAASAPSTGLPGLPSLSAGENTPATAGTGLPSLPGASSASTGLPALPGSGASSSGSSLPSLPGSSAASSGLPALPGSGASSSGSSLPALPGASSASTGLPALPGSGASSSDSSLPALPGVATLTAPPSLPAIPSLPGTGMSAPPSGLPPSLPSAASSSDPVSAPTSLSGGSDNPANLQWIYDYGAAANAAASSGKKILLFYVAPGNRVSARYETEYFTAPAVRSLLDQFVLAKINFAQNTKQAYEMKVFGAGIIVVTDTTGKRLLTIDAIPQTPDDFAKKLSEIK